MSGEGMTEDEMVEWYHWLNGHEFEQALGVGDGQGSCSPWGRKDLDTTEKLKWAELKVAKDFMGRKLMKGRVVCLLFSIEKIIEIFEWK